MSRLGVLFVVACVLTSASWARGDVTEVSDPRLVQVLTHLHLLSEKSGPVASTIRLVVVPDRGECDGSPESCPRAELLVAIVELEDPAVAKLFSLGRSYGWEVVSWGDTIRLPDDKCNSGPYQSITLRKKVVSEEPAVGWWAYEELELLVNPMCARVRPAKKE